MTLSEMVSEYEANPSARGLTRLLKALAEAVETRPVDPVKPEARNPKQKG